MCSTILTNGNSAVGSTNLNIQLRISNRVANLLKGAAGGKHGEAGGKGDQSHGGGAGGSNKGTTNPEYLAEVEGRIAAFLEAHPYLSREEVPSEMVTASGSGLDPDISVRGAEVQARRVAQARGMDEQEVLRIIGEQTEGPWLGLFGTSKVNVLKLNVALDAAQKAGRN